MDNNLKPQSTTPTIPASPISNDEALQQRKKRIVKRLVILGIIILGITIPLLPWNKKQQNDPTMATIHDKPIRLSDVRNIALEQYEPSAVDREALRLAYDILIERQILDIEAKRLSITVSNEEVADRLKKIRIDNSPVPAAIWLATKYDILREKMIKKTVKSREAYSVGFYIASYDEQKELSFSPLEKRVIQRQRLAGTLALTQIEQRLRRGELPLYAAKLAFEEYPSLQPIIAVNGYILGSPHPEKALENPKIYTYDGYVDQPFFNNIYSMRPNQIKKVEEKDGSGGYVIQVKTVNPTGEESYSAWLEKKKQELVKTNNNTL